MSISQTELQKIAEKLSKIPGNNPKHLQNITDILGYMDLLSEVDTQGVIPTISVVENRAHLRDDSCINTLGTNPNELLSCSEQKVVGNQVILPNIMK